MSEALNILEEAKKLAKTPYLTKKPKVLKARRALFAQIAQNIPEVQKELILMQKEDENTNLASLISGKLSQSGRVVMIYFITPNSFTAHLKIREMDKKSGEILTEKESKIIRDETEEHTIKYPEDYLIFVDPDNYDITEQYPDIASDELDALVSQTIIDLDNQLFIDVL